MQQAREPSKCPRIQPSSEESETQEACEVRDLELSFKGLKKPSLAKFSGDREL